MPKDGLPCQAQGCGRRPLPKHTNTPPTYPTPTHLILAGNHQSFMPFRILRHLYSVPLSTSRRAIHAAPSAIHAAPRGGAWRGQPAGRAAAAQTRGGRELAGVRGAARRHRYRNGLGAATLRGAHDAVLCLSGNRILRQAGQAEETWASRHGRQRLGSGSDRSSRLAALARWCRRANKALLHIEFLYRCTMDGPEAPAVHTGHQTPRACGRGPGHDRTFTL